MTTPEVRRAQVQVVDHGPVLPLVGGPGEARAIIWPGMGARLRSTQRISLGARSRTIELQHSSEAVYYIIAGGGLVRDVGEATHEVSEGAMFLVEPGTRYVIEAGPDGAEVVGGPCPPDPALYRGLTESTRPDIA